MTRKIEVCPPQKNWAEQFEREKIILEKIFGQQVIRIYHIGSTAINNIIAKPVIDILMVVKEIQKVESYNREMTKIGYECLGENGIQNRRFFYKGRNNRSHHLHVFQKNHPEIQRHLLFKDFMNTHPKEAEAYSQLKIELAKKFPYDIKSYMAGKNGFIKNIDQEAKEWHNKFIQEKRN